MMREAFLDLIDFDRANGVAPSGGRPRIPTIAAQLLRRRLLREEFEETIAAIQRGYNDDVVDELAIIAEIADGLADLIYVCVGTALAYGVDLPAIWREVHSSNMAKFSGGVIRDSGRKVVKPPGWAPPDIAGILATQRPLADTYGGPRLPAGDGDLAALVGDRIRWATDRLVESSRDGVDPGWFGYVSALRWVVDTIVLRRRGQPRES